MTAHQTQTRSSSFGIERRVVGAGHEDVHLRQTREVVEACVWACGHVCAFGRTRLIWCMGVCAQWHARMRMSVRVRKHARTCVCVCVCADFPRACPVHPGARCLTFSATAKTMVFRCAFIPASFNHAKNASMCVSTCGVAGKSWVDHVRVYVCVVCVCVRVYVRARVGACTGRAG